MLHREQEEIKRLEISLPILCLCEHLRDALSEICLASFFILIQFITPK
jgi:hypothetical protein